MAMLQRVIQCARSYLPERFFASAPQLLWTGAAAASASAPSNPLSEALWLAAPKSKVQRELYEERSRAPWGG